MPAIAHSASPWRGFESPKIHSKCWCGFLFLFFFGRTDPFTFLPTGSCHARGLCSFSGCFFFFWCSRSRLMFLSWTTFRDTSYSNSNSDHTKVQSATPQRGFESVVICETVFFILFATNLFGPFPNLAAS
jgi:hypothetical protein